MKKEEIHDARKVWRSRSHCTRVDRSQDMSDTDCSGPMNIKVTDRCHITFSNLADIEC